MVSKVILVAVCLGVLGMVSGRSYYGKKYVKRTRPGVCPRIMGDVYGQTCTDDFDCPEFMKCCSFGFAGTTCTYVTGGPRPFPRPKPQPFPVDPLPGPGPLPGLEKPGMCPASRRIGPCVHQCSSDYQCPGDLKCCSIGCGTQCRRPSLVKKY